MKNNLSKQNRSIIAQLRFGILPLKIETGRFQGLPIDQRICELCRSAVEDEIHFVCQCPFFNKKRFDYFENISSQEFIGLEDTAKFIYLMQNTTRQFASYVLSIWEARKNYLYN